MQEQSSINTNLKKPEVVLVLPVFSGGTLFLAAINENCLELVKKMPFVNWTILIINDGSVVLPSENTIFQNLSASINYHYYHYENNMGKGYAVRFGLNKAPEADIFIYTDFDFPFGTAAVINAVNILLQDEADVVAADRGSRYLSFLPFSRKIITRAIRIINSKVLKLNFTDTQAGLKGMNSKSLPAMLCTSINSFLFDLQFIRNAAQQRLRIYALSVECTKNIQLKNFRLGVIWKELKNLFILLFKTHAKENSFSSYCGFRGIRYSSGIWTDNVMENADRNHLAGVGTATDDAAKFEN